MIACPRCSYENEDSAVNCVNCRINLQWALENMDEAVRDDLERKERPPVPPGTERVASVETRPVRGFLVIVLLLASLVLLSMGCRWALVLVSLDTVHHAPSEAVQIGVALVAATGIVAVTVLLRRQPRPDLLGGLKLAAGVALVGALGFGLMRLTLVILPEHTARSLVIQYRLGERDFRGARLSGADLSKVNLRGARLQQANLRDASLSKAYLRHADLSGADLSGADLSSTDLSYAEMRETDLHGAYLHAADLFGADLRGADLSNADLGNAGLAEADLRTARMHEAYLCTARLYSADLRGADLRGANLSQAKLERANLAGVLLDNATQIDARWRLVHDILNLGAQGRDLAGADLREANLSGANLRGANLSGANLEQANLREAELREADLSEARLWYADLSRANLSGAIVTPEQLAAARSLVGATMPDGSVHK